MQSLVDIAEAEKVEVELEKLLQKIHLEGPTNPLYIEQLTFYKVFHKKIFELYEEKIISVLGLFYKNSNPNSLVSRILSVIGETYKKEYDESLTPIQANFRRAIDENKYVSISAPTSAGKSYAIRDYIKKTVGDCVIIVPSRALIAEYISTLKGVFNDDKSVMILPFVDYVFQNRQLKRIFILTPERARELFTYPKKDKITLFFFDEAHISEEDGRGIIFDSLVQRIKRHFIRAKMIFAHPFVENPEAQLKKHNIDIDKSFSVAYKQNTVGKVFVYQHNNKNDYYFSPYSAQGHLLKKCIKFKGGFEEFAFNGQHTVLVYASKKSIYDGKHIDMYLPYIDKFSEVIDVRGVKIIKEIESIIGANTHNHESYFIQLLKKGVVIHHGSVPLEVRFLIEEFMRLGLSKICFATSTLAQGVNMPFDIIILDNIRMNVSGESEIALAFKNLIGRSGRLTNKLQFDYGYVYTKNPQKVSERLNYKYHISEESFLNLNVDNLDPDDDTEFIESIVKDTFNDKFNLPDTKIERLSSGFVQDSAREILNLIFLDNKVIVDSSHRMDVIKHFKIIYEASLAREISEGEYEVFKNAMFIFFNIVLKKSFKEIVAARYKYFISKGVCAQFSQPAQKLPSKGLVKYSLFPDKLPISKVSYDLVVYDTYDYLDQVLSFSLLDVFIATFSILYEKEGDRKAMTMINMLKYNTDDLVSIWLMRYGIPVEYVEQISTHVSHIDEHAVIFHPSINEADLFLKNIVSWYLPQEI